MQSATVRLDNPAHLLLGASLSPSTTNHPDRPPQQRLSNGARHACAGSAAGFAGAEEAFCHASSDAEPRIQRTSSAAAQNFPQPAALHHEEVRRAAAAAASQVPAKQPRHTRHRLVPVNRVP